MVKLFLAPSSDRLQDRGSVEEKLSLLDKLESIIWSAILSGGRWEARLWLCSTISSIHSITPYEQRDLFVELLRIRNSKHDVAAQLLRMIFEKRPDKAGSIISKKCCILEKFFEGHPKRILDWFDHFATAGESGHKKGARALSKYAFMNRDSCWEELDWKGRHGQSPAVVATKPHYLHDLDVLQTVNNFLEYVPGFWSSDELADSVKDGEIIKIDEVYFVDKFLQLMYEDRMEDVWLAIEEFVLDQQFAFLCQHLLIILDDSGLLTFINSISKLFRANANAQCKELKYPSCWLEILLSTCNGSISVDELIMLNAVTCHGRKLLCLLTDEEHEEEKQRVEKLLMNSLEVFDTDHWVFMEECMKMKKQVAIKFIGLRSWIIHYLLAMKCKTQESYESIFSENGISFHKADGFSLLEHNEIDDCVLETDDDHLDKRHYSRGRRGKKRRKKKHNHTIDNADAFWEFEQSNCLQDWQSTGSWRLSTDSYSCAWNEVDLPEHLSMHCFSMWMKWILFKW